MVCQMSQGGVCYPTPFPSHWQSLQVVLGSGTSQEWAWGFSRQGISVPLKIRRCSSSDCLKKSPSCLSHGGI